MGFRLLISDSCSQRFQNGFLEVCSVDVIIPVELVSLKLTRLTPTGDGAPCDVVPTLFFEDSFNVKGLQDLLFGLHGFLSHQVCRLSLGIKSPSEFCSASTHSYSMPSITL